MQLDHVISLIYSDFVYIAVKSHVTKSNSFALLKCQFLINI